MKEITFLKQNQKRWLGYEKSFENKEGLTPDQSADIFISLSDDLSYALTNYPNSKTAAYLNGVLAKFHQDIYRNKKEKKNRLAAFWRFELPQLVSTCHKQLFYSFLIFTIAVLLGMVSTLNDSNFVRVILGDSYVNMTLENIEKGDPMAVYKKMRQMDMFLGITINNIRVSFFAFIAGILWSVGSGAILFSNGVMLGAFQTFFYTKGLLLESMLVIWIHGTVEISAIILAGGAGIVMGNSILFPRTFSRLESFKKGVRKGAKLAFGLVPIFIAAGFLEGFVTRHTNMPLYLSLLIIFGSLAFIIWYFIIYPIKLRNTYGTD